ncbi:hypothetical protein M878_44675 [Streptomyces roseochromogenus subsp. oscitans DS 12.976]|uniref:Uncharacterized protein n=1 Tax=Streptomyces roseochromogenus subsp. oscitans DS 12.976 TaxID=1352936 RepID=V6JF11_STRRC|nr:hypothetical protein M878_44675 [Streptomyces roseochromogenus subsp. oscitans DS 12.976]
MPCTSGMRAWLPCRLAPEMPTDRGRPVRSLIKWIFEPYLPRSTGFGPANSPLFRARTFTESITRRDRSRSPRESNSSRTRRWSFGQTWAFDHSVNRR